jgi:hypothetical protein
MGFFGLDTEFIGYMPPLTVLVIAVYTVASHQLSITVPSLCNNSVTISHT